MQQFYPFGDVFRHFILPRLWRVRFKSLRSRCTMSIALAGRGQPRGFLLICLLALPALALAVLAIVQSKNRPSCSTRLCRALRPRWFPAAACWVGGGVFPENLRQSACRTVTPRHLRGSVTSPRRIAGLRPGLMVERISDRGTRRGDDCACDGFRRCLGPHLSSQTLVLAGVMINLFCNAAYAGLVLFNHDFLSNLLTWQAGSLQQSGWGPSLRLALLAAFSLGPLLLLERPLQRSPSVMVRQRASVFRCGR